MSDKIKETNVKKDLRMYYKKILFYVNSTSFDKEVRQEVISKINKEIQSKKIV